MPSVTARRPDDVKCHELFSSISSGPARDVCIWVLDCLYKPPENLTKWEHISSLGDNIKGNIFQPNERKQLKSLLEDEKNIIDFDIGILYKIIQKTCGLKDIKDPVWIKEFEGPDDSIERKLYQLKDIRNEYHHNDKSFKCFNRLEWINLINDLLHNKFKYLIYESGNKAEYPKQVTENKFIEIEREISQMLSPLDLEEENIVDNSLAILTSKDDEINSAMDINIPDFMATLTTLVTDSSSPGKETNYTRNLDTDREDIMDMDPSY